MTDLQRVGDNEPTWSREGARNAFTRTFPDEDLRGEVWIVDPDGGNQRWLEVGGFTASWSPDGARLIFAVAAIELACGQSDIMTCATDGSDRQAPTETPENEEGPIRSPDASRIAFVADHNGDRDLYAVRSDGTDIRRITGHDALDFSPRWSPDGVLLTFTSDLPGGREYEAYSIGVDRANLTRVTYARRPATSINPVWRPVGGGIG